MMTDHHTIVVPRGALLGAGAVIVLSIGLAAAARNARVHSPAVPLAPPRQVIELRFADRADGSIVVGDAATGREVSVLPARSSGFVRGVLRGMFRNRKLESMGPDARFRLAREADGRLTLIDPETGRRVDLDSFGPTNSASFAELLAAGLRAPGGAAVPAPGGGDR
jgi:putative photosynthetic complex assembly protein